MPSNKSHRSKARVPRKSRAQQLPPRMDLVRRDKAVSIDIEGCLLPNETGANKSGAARISIVAEDGTILLDKFGYHPKSTNARPPPQRLKLGVTYADLRPENGAEPIAKVLQEALAILDGSAVIIGHDIGQEINYLRDIWENTWQTRDTQRAPCYAHYHSRGKPSLQTLSREILGEEIQGEEHNSVEDARATMKLYLRERPSIDLAQATVIPPAVQATTSASKTPATSTPATTTPATSTLATTTAATASSAAGPSKAQPNSTSTPPAVARATLSWAAVAAARKPH